MVFNRFVEVGRVVYINYGPETGKLATIIDIVDSNKCLIEGPADITGVQRQVISFSRISIMFVKFTRNCYRVREHSRDVLAWLRMISTNDTWKL